MEMENLLTPVKVHCPEKVILKQSILYQVLFDRRKGEWGVVRSATFHEGGDDETEEDEEDDDEMTEVRNSTPGRKIMHRSSTMPIDAENPSTTPLTSIGSTFKLPFT